MSDAGAIIVSLRENVDQLVGLLATAEGLLDGERNETYNLKLELADAETHIRGLEQQVSNLTARLRQYENAYWPKDGPTPIDALAEAHIMIDELQDQLELQMKLAKKLRKRNDRQREIIIERGLV